MINPDLLGLKCCGFLKGEKKKKRKQEREEGGRRQKEGETER